MSIETIGGVVHDQVVVPDAPLPEGQRVAIKVPRTVENVLAEMAAAQAPLVQGHYLSLDEFLRRWEAMPELKRAELIRGVVYMPSPLSRLHAVMDQNVAGWLLTYRAATPGVEGANNASWVMGDADAPQPDNSLYILPEFGGRIGMQGNLLKGAPDFLEETCLTSTSYDLHQKLDVYQEACVQEYLAVILQRNEVRWHRLVNARFEVQPAPVDGIYRSAVFPGLWLDAPALLAGDLARVLAVLNQGIASPEHAAFVQQLAARRQSP
jgi:Uma2 family endonuclease